ncbi:MAG: DUF502 domain-containing protein [Candidatus Nanohaloarchaea archaeon]
MREELKRSFIAGLIVTVPVASVIILLDWLFSTASSVIPSGLFRFTQYSTANQVIGLVIVSFISIFLVIILGFVFKSYLGRKAEEKIDILFEKVPVIGTVYSMAKSTSREVFDGSEKFKKPVKVQTGNIRRTAFKTGQTSDGREVLFMPTSPNITSGFVIEVEPENIIETDESTEEALERLLSAGFGGK